MSQKAHERLRKKYHSKGTSPKNNCYGNYHSDVYDNQNKRKRLLTKQEKRSLFRWWRNYEINGKMTKYPL